VNDEVVRIMITGLVELGIQEGDIDTLIAEDAHRQFYMHGLGRCKKGSASAVRRLLLRMAQ